MSKGGGFLGGRSASVGANVIHGITGVNVDPDPLGMRRKNQDPEKNKDAEALSHIATQLFEQTDPVRKNLIGRSTDFLNGGLDVRDSPMYASLKTAADSQFGRARDNTIARTAAGGGLTDALAGLESDRANTMVEGTGQIAQGELDRAFGLGTGLLPQTTQGLGTAANIQAQQLLGEQQQSAAAKQGAGTGLGMLAASFLS